MIHSLIWLGHIVYKWVQMLVFHQERGDRLIYSLLTFKSYQFLLHYFLVHWLFPSHLGGNDMCALQLLTRVLILIT